MYHDGDKTTLEASDIAQVLAAPEMLTLASGRQMLLVGLVINPDSGKTYAQDEAPEKLHLTDGVQHRLLQFSPLLDTLMLSMDELAIQNLDVTSEAPEPEEATPTAEAPAALSNDEAAPSGAEPAAEPNVELPEAPEKAPTPEEPAPSAPDGAAATAETPAASAVVAEEQAEA